MTAVTDGSVPQKNGAANDGLEYATFPYTSIRLVPPRGDGYAAVDVFSALERVAP